MYNLYELIILENWGGVFDSDRPTLISKVAFEIRI